MQASYTVMSKSDSNVMLFDFASIAGSLYTFVKNQAGPYQMIASGFEVNPTDTLIFTLQNNVTGKEVHFNTSGLAVGLTPDGEQLLTPTGEPVLIPGAGNSVNVSVVDDRMTVGISPDLLDLALDDVADYRSAITATLRRYAGLTVNSTGQLPVLIYP